MAQDKSSNFGPWKFNKWDLASWYQFFLVQKRICLFSGWLREINGPSLLEAFAPQLVSKKMCVPFLFILYILLVFSNVIFILIAIHLTVGLLFYLAILVILWILGSSSWLYILICRYIEGVCDCFLASFLFWLDELCSVNYIFILEVLTL